jgi:hypothetical protein
LVDDERAGSPAASLARTALRRRDLVRGRAFDITLIVVGAAVLVSSAVFAKRGVYGWEIAIFQTVNGLPSSLRSFL